MRDNSQGKKVAVFLRAAVIMLITWMIVRYALRWLLPFAAPLCLARLLEPVVRLMCRRFGLPRAVASALCTVATLAILAALVALIITQSAASLSTLARRLAEPSGGLSETISSLSIWLRNLIETAPSELQAPIRSALEGLPGRATDIAAALSKGIISLLSAILSAGPKILLFVFTCALGTFFVSGTYAQVTAFIVRQIPERYHCATREILFDLRQTSGKWLKAQLILSGLTFGELLVLFCVLRVDFAVILALIVAIADMLPAVGTGIVLIPWAIVSVAGGNTGRAVLLLSGYAVIILVRSIFEPKLLSRGLGLPPIATLIAMYTGFAALGVIGMATFPVALIMLKHLHDRGYIRLWK